MFKHISIQLSQVNQWNSDIDFINFSGCVLHIVQRCNHLVGFMRFSCLLDKKIWLSGYFYFERQYLISPIMRSIHKNFIFFSLLQSFPLMERLPTCLGPLTIFAQIWLFEITKGSCEIVGMSWLLIVWSFHSGISIFLIISFLLKDLESQSLWNKEFILNTISHDPCFLLSSSSSQWASIVWSFPPLFRLPMAAWLLSHPKYHCPICSSIQGKIFLIVNHLSLQRSDD